MALLDGAYTALTAAGLPGFATWVEYSTPRSYEADFTEKSPGGLAKQTYGTFTHAELTDLEITVSDTASISATESPVDSQEIAVSDTARLSLTETSQLFNYLQSTDTASLGLSETVALTITGVTNIAPTDTASLTLTESVALSVTVGVTDTTSLQLTSEAGTVATTVVEKSASDTASLSVSDASLLSIFSGVNAISVVDDIRLSVAETAQAVEVLRIKRIELELDAPSIELEIL